jgi:hypothetical protein
MKLLRVRTLSDSYVLFLSLIVYSLFTRHGYHVKSLLNVVSVRHLFVGTIRVESSSQNVIIYIFTP